MASIQIKVQGDDAFKQALKQLENKASNLKPYFDDLGEYMVLSTRERFDREVDPDGNRWPELAPATVARKARKNKNPKILQQDSILRDSITPDATQDQLEMGTNLEYGPTHQYGDSSRNIPARPYLGFSDQDLQEAMDLIGDHLQL